MAKFHSTTRIDLYQTVTDRIVSALEAGTAPWVKPWGTSQVLGIPVNASTMKRYRGVNVLTLWLTQQKQGYARSRWMTFLQAKEHGGFVRKGEKGTPVVYFESREIKDQTDEDGEPKRVPLLKHFIVFNIAQIDGLQQEFYPEVGKPREPFLEIARAQAWANALPGAVRHGGDRAFYSHGQDFIGMPEKSAFQDSGSYFATLSHEYAHWSGHESRLARAFGKRFGDEAYAVEELTAELSSAFTCAVLGIEGKLRHESYLGDWIKVLKSDKRAIFQVASAAQKATDLLMELAGNGWQSIGPEPTARCDAESSSIRMAT